MAIENVQVSINGDTENMSNVQGSTYAASMSAPYVSTNRSFPVTVKATDTAGNVTTASPEDVTYQELLQLHVLASAESDDTYMKYRTELMDNILKSPKAREIINYVTPQYGEAYVCLWIFEVIGQTLDEDYYMYEEFLKQVVPDTATWSLPYWEKRYGIVPDQSYTTEQRRNNILNRKSYKVPTNPYSMKKYLEDMTGLQVDLTEHTAKNTFDIFIHGYPYNLDEVKAFIEKYKPAHLICNLKAAESQRCEAPAYYGITVSQFQEYNVTVSP